jgi:uncharacterized damage-inducible protein DinB
VTSVLQDLLRHEAWADAKLLQAIRSCAAAPDDSIVRERLRHSHDVQRVYLAVLHDEPVDLEALQLPSASFDELAASVMRYHGAMAVFLENPRADILDRAAVLRIPGYDDREMTLGDAMAQMAMRSQYHRGQVATRLRELGGEPPLMDFIVWVWEGRPASPADV